MKAKIDYLQKPIPAECTLTKNEMVIMGYMQLPSYIRATLLNFIIMMTSINVKHESHHI